MHINLKGFASCLLFGLFLSTSCKPVIHSFSVTINGADEVRKMSLADSLSIRYNVAGKPTLLFNEAQLDEKKVREFTLLVERYGRTVRQLIQVEVLPDTAETTIAFVCKFNTNKDSLVAEGIKNPGVWGNDFVIMLVTNPTNRLLKVYHEGLVAELPPNSTSRIFKGLPVEGAWSLRYGLASAERADHTTLPEMLQVITTIQHK